MQPSLPPEVAYNTNKMTFIKLQQKQFYKATR